MFTAFLYYRNETDRYGSKDFQSFDTKEEAIECCKAMNWNEVINDETGEVVWKKEEKNMNQNFLEKKPVKPFKYTGPAPKPQIKLQPKNKMNLDEVEKYFGFATYFVENEVILTFVCLNLPDEKHRCFGIQVDENNIPKSSLLYILKLNELNESVIDDISVYINAYQI